MPVPGHSYVVVSTVFSLLLCSFLVTACNTYKQPFESQPPEHLRFSSTHSTKQLSADILQSLTASTNKTPLPIPDSDLLRANHEKYASIDTHDFVSPKFEPIVKLDMDNDTASYSNVRRFLQQGYMPPSDAVRIEELLNYFSFSSFSSASQLPAPIKDQFQPQFRPYDSGATVNLKQELATSPWNPNRYLLNLTLSTPDTGSSSSAPRHIVFLVDSSGSMRTARKLTLLKQSIKLAAQHLDDDDRISIITYADQTRIRLASCPVHRRKKISSTIDSITANGTSSNLHSGINQAYTLASRQDSRIEQHIFLASDGDVSGDENTLDNIHKTIEEYKNHKIRLSTLGLGVGNFNDDFLEQLSRIGSGNYSYIDNLAEAHRVLVKILPQRLKLSARDLTGHFEFNPTVVKQYRLIGFDRRIQKAIKSSKSDRRYPANLHPGQSITMMFELVLYDHVLTKALRYQQTDSKQHNEIALIRFNYLSPDSNKPNEITKILRVKSIKNNKTTDHFRFFAAVAAFGQKLRGDAHIKNYSYSSILKLAQQARGNDPDGDRNQFISMVQLAKSLSEIAVVSNH